MKSFFDQLGNARRNTDPIEGGGSLGIFEPIPRRNTDPLGGLGAEGSADDMVPLGSALGGNAAGGKGSGGMGPGGKGSAGSGPGLGPGLGPGMGFYILHWMGLHQIQKHRKPSCS